MKLGGIIYLLSIADKMKGTTRKNLDIFHQLCGDEALSKVRVVLGTTKWKQMNEGIGENRERQLAKIFWSTITASGSKMLRFDRTEKSARAFLDAILCQLKFGKNGEILNDNVLQIQKEIVDLSRRIPETAAGKVLSYTLERLRKFGLLKDRAKFEKVTTLSVNIKNQAKNDPNMMKSPPVMILYSLFSLFSQLFGLTRFIRLMGEVGAGKSTVRLLFVRKHKLFSAKASSSTLRPAKLWPRLAKRVTCTPARGL